MQPDNNARIVELMTDKSLLIIDAVLALVGIGLAVYAAWTLHRVGRIRSAFGDKNKPVDLEELLSVLALKIKNLERETQVLTEKAGAVRHHTGTSVQKVGLVRFNSFADEGGNLSFVCALLDEHDTGVVLTSLHGRQQNRIYAKQIHQGESETPLSEEEQGAIKSANQIWQDKFKH